MVSEYMVFQPWVFVLTYQEERIWTLLLNIYKGNTSVYFTERIFRYNWVRSKTKAILFSWLV